MSFDIKFTRRGFENASFLKPSPGKLDIKRHEPGILYLASTPACKTQFQTINCFHPVNDGAQVPAHSVIYYLLVKETRTTNQSLIHKSIQIQKKRFDNLRDPLQL